MEVKIKSRKEKSVLIIGNIKSEFLENLKSLGYNIVKARDLEEGEEKVLGQKFSAMFIDESAPIEPSMELALKADLDVLMEVSETD